MLDRTLVIPVADPRLISKQTRQWMRAFNGGPKRGPGYEYPCWVCGEIGMIGVDGFGAKGLVRPRNMQHMECWDSVDDKTRQMWRIRDTKHILRRAQRMRSKRNLDRVTIRERSIYAGYYESHREGASGSREHDPED